MPDERQRGDEANAGRRQLCFGGDLLHLESYKVVDEADRPEFLGHAPRRSAAKRLFTVEHLRFHLVVSELDLPALVVERDDLLGRVFGSVDERREEPLRRKAGSVISDGTYAPSLRQRLVGFARLAAYVE